MNRFLLLGQGSQKGIEEVGVGDTISIGATLATALVTSVTAGLTTAFNLLYQDISVAMTAGTGITDGTGTVYKAGVEKVGDIFVTRMLIDLTGLNSIDTDLDIIGDDGTSNPCHFGQITTAVNGVVFAGKMHCLVLPATGDPDIDLYSATEGTGVENGLVTDLTQTELLDSAGDWAAGDVKIIVPPAADEYLYLVQGDATGTDGTYTAGQFMLELYGV